MITTTTKTVTTTATAEIKILEYLSVPKRRLMYKGMKTTLLGLPDFKYYKYQTLANRCSKLKQSGYVAEINGEYKITQKGREYLRKKKNTLQHFEFTVEKGLPKNLLLLYDIPEGKKREREWFRIHLKKLGFLMIQRSVWVGPMPKEFLDYVKLIGLKKMIETFKLARGYSMKN